MEQKVYTTVKIITRPDGSTRERKSVSKYTPKTPAGSDKRFRTKKEVSKTAIAKQILSIDDENQLRKIKEAIDGITADEPRENGDNTLRGEADT